MLFDDPKLSLREEDFRLLGELINRACGIRLDRDARTATERKLRDRVTHLGLTSFRDYYHHLRYDPEAAAELERAVDLLTTNETYLFRGKTQLDAFAAEVLPRLRDQAAARRRLTIWSAGCSTGEEVYTLAILVRESGLFDGWDVRVFGNDISRRVLQVARKAIYRESSFRALPDEYAKYFIKTGQGRVVDPRVQAMCHFGHVNLLDAGRVAMVGRVDAIFCRNVLIYFDETSRRCVIQTFYERLHPGGFLMLGHSESLLNLSTAFELAHLKGDLAYRKPEPVRFAAGAE